jgi:hypothetical protein
MNVAWRGDILLLEEAAKRCCTPCYSEIPLSDQGTHLIIGGAKVYCSAVFVNAMMGLRTRIPMEEFAAAYTT